MRKLVMADADVMRMAIQQEIARSDESRYDHRLHGLLLVTGGHSCQQVAELFGEDRRTVQRWVTRVDTHGLTGLRDGARLGRPATLNTKQWAALGRDLRREPQTFGHAGHLWDGSRSRRICACATGWRWGAPVPTNLRPHGISAAQAQTPSRPVRPGQGRGV